MGMHVRLKDVKRPDSIPRMLPRQGVNYVGFVAAPPIPAGRIAAESLQPGMREYISGR